MWLEESVDLDEKFSETRRSIIDSVREDLVRLRKTMCFVKEHNITDLIPHTNHEQIYVSSGYIEVDMPDTVESRRALHRACQLDFDITWGARMVPFYRNGRRLERCERVCELRHDADGIRLKVKFNGVVEVKDGDTLPSGCVITIESEAHIARTAVSCAMR